MGDFFILISWQFSAKIKKLVPTSLLDILLRFRCFDYVQRPQNYNIPKQVCPWCFMVRCGSE